MVPDLIQNQGRDLEIAGTRITVYDLLPYFLDPTATEAYICRVYQLSSEQVAAARAYVLNNPEKVLAEHLKIETRLEAGNAPEVIEQAKKTHATFLAFKKWLIEHPQERKQNNTAEGTPTNSDQLATFREWLAEQESKPFGAP